MLGDSTFDVNGQDVFDLLFGREPQKRGQLLGAAFDMSAANPTRHPCRIHSLTACHIGQKFKFRTIEGEPISFGGTVRLDILTVRVLHTSGNVAGYRHRRFVASSAPSAMALNLAHMTVG